MIFLRAFLFGGAICALIHLLYVKMKFSVVQTLTLGFFMGGILTATGLMEKIVAWADGGMILMIIDSGEAVYWWMTAILTNGDFSGCIRYAVLILGSFVISAFGGKLYAKRLIKIKAHNKSL
jgi:hypothetical protein